MSAEQPLPTNSTSSNGRNRGDSRRLDGWRRCCPVIRCRSSVVFFLPSPAKPGEEPFSYSPLPSGERGSFLKQQAQAGDTALGLGELGQVDGPDVEAEL